jgi:hypothetical protein
MKTYNIFLDNKKIGTTELEKADAPMGVVFGKINFIDIPSGYDFFRRYCIVKNIEIIIDDPEEKLISTRTIENLVVKNELGIAIIPLLGNQIIGMDSNDFEITLEGVPYPFFEQEFPDHVKTYNDRFKDE